jgi:hypothetical protein
MIAFNCGRVENGWKEVGSLQRSEGNDLSDVIVVVSGLPRSGTSMMMAMLQSGGLKLLKDGIRTPDDDNPKGYYEFERVKKLREGDLGWLPEAQGKVVKIISYLLLHLPENHNYRIIFMERRLAEVMASQRKMLVRRGEDPDKVSEDELEAVLEKHLQQVQDWIERQANVERISVNYNRMLEDPEDDILRINNFLGGNLDVGKMAQVIDPDLYRQRK